MSKKQENNDEKLSNSTKYEILKNFNFKYTVYYIPYSDFCEYPGPT
jgi:hypothetical protein